MISAKDSAIDRAQFDHWQIETLERMLDQSCFDEDRRMMIASEIASIEHGSQEDYDELYFRLHSNQRDRISSGDNYSQRDIIEHLKKLK